MPLISTQAMVFSMQACYDKEKRPGTISMTIGELLFLVSIFGVLVLVTISIIALVRRNRRLARNLSVGILLWVCLYTTVLMGASLLTPQRVLALRQEHCFDEMCFSVTQ